MQPSQQRSVVSEYYGKTLKSSEDLRTSACCPIDAVPHKHRTILSQLHPDVVSRFYGCGSPIPDFLSGAVVLDLGCGTGRDAFLAAALVGQGGKVIGVDMTEEQLKVARDTTEYHTKRFFGEHGRTNTEFRHGYAEDLTTANVKDAQVDVVISNCVCNLSTDKRSMFSEIARVLKDGGEFYFSDVYADRRLSVDARKDSVLVAECLGGALYIEDFRRVMADVGFKDVRVVSSAIIEVHDARLRALVPDVTFYSVTFRAFKISDLEDRRENYGQFATYSSCCGVGLKLDAHFNFVKGVKTPVDANTAAILQKARFADKFTVTARGQHQGLFAPQLEGGIVAAALATPQSQNGSACATTEKDKKEQCCTPSDVKPLPAKLPEVRVGTCGSGGSCR